MKKKPDADHDIPQNNTHARPTRITVIDYDEKYFEEKEIGQIEDLAAYRMTQTVTWINFCGLPAADVLDRLAELFGIHPLTVEDILNTGQRPKLEDLVHYIYAAVKTVGLREMSNKILTTQVSLVITKQVVLSFEERDGEIFESIREKLRKYKGRIRKMGTDYLAYRLLDAIVDGYFGILEKIGDNIESLEERVVTNPTPDVLKAIHSLRIETTTFFKSVWPLREVVGALTRDEFPMLRKDNVAYFRDIYDHTVQIIETMETNRDIISSMLDIYVSSISNRMNEIMKVLTIISTIFMPMTFLAGVYGMNFKYFPELGYRWAYLAFWVVVGVIAVLMILYFRRKKWF
jgi:magnesium transporter